MKGTKRKKNYYDELRKKIRKEIHDSPHYNPKDRVRIGRRYGGEKMLWDWTKKLCCDKPTSGPASLPKP